MNSEEFLQRVSAVVDDLSLAISLTPHDRQEEALRDIAERVRTQWRQAFASLLPAEDVDGLVEDFIGKVRARCQQFEAAGGGRA